MLRRVIALFRQMTGGVMQTLGVGPALRERTALLGNNSSAMALSRLQPANIQQSQNSDPVLLISMEQKHGSGKITALLTNRLTVDGSRFPTHARQRQQLAKQVLKLAKKVASKTKAAAKRTRAKAPVQTHMASLSGALGN